jgi:hypothetical protein
MTLLCNAWQAASSLRGARKMSGFADALTSRVTSPSIGRSLDTGELGNNLSPAPACASRTARHDAHAARVVSLTPCRRRSHQNRELLTGTTLRHVYMFAQVSRHRAHQPQIQEVNLRASSNFVARSVEFVTWPMIYCVHFTCMRA